ncbi:MAG: CDGSH iron-sulfur domain-containing protein [Jatrophihabitans sp.]|uniref:CDGSH iron-sulfur domain-containing protein n=1 Tax=Jatrophihabitans sp. TaxID=1932789 RepID=UPI00390F2C6D
MNVPAAAEEPVEEPAATLTPYPDGPLVLRGDFEIRSVDGACIESGRTVALCRCGRSAVKPFCDGSHKIARALGGARTRTSPRD